MKPSRIIYSAAEMAWLEANRATVISDYHRAFSEAFGRSDVSAANLHGLRKRKGWKVGRAPGRYIGRHRSYSSAEIEWLRANCTLEFAEYQAAFVAAFPGRQVSAQNLNGLRKRMGWRTGRTGHFAKGSEPANKGKVCPDGIGGRHPNARRNQFRPGQEPHNTKGLGHERLTDDGYIMVSVAETNPHTGYERRYVLKHVHLWEQANGPIPEGHCLKCLDENRANADPSNWTLIPRGALPRLNGGRATRHLSYAAAAPEIRPVLLTVAKIGQRARELKRRRPVT